jgi:ABC-2 type transport system permease protein
LRNLEYDLTRSIKRSVYGFQSIDSVFASLEEPAMLSAFVTPNTLPAGLQPVPEIVEKVALDLQAASGGKLDFEVIDPDAPGSQITRQVLINSYGLTPIATSLFSPDSYYLHLLLQAGDEGFLIYPSGDLSEADIRSELEAALKRLAPGFLKTVGLWLPPSEPVQNMFGEMVQPISSWNLVQEQLRQDYSLEYLDLATGRVPGDIDVVVIVAPQNLGDEERFAIDQYLMRGGAVVVAGGAYVLAPQQMPGGLVMQRVEGGLEEMLESYGIKVHTSMVLDPRSEPFPVQVQRQVSGMSVIEIQEVTYPYFVDVRPDAMDKESPIVSDLPAVTLQWVSPLETMLSEGQESTVLLQSTSDAWTRDALDVQPNQEVYPGLGFAVEGEPQQHNLAIAVQGSFDSYFKDRGSPFQSEILTDTVDGLLGTVEVSPESARLVVIGSSEFLDDAVLDISSRLSADRYLYNLQLLQNAVDWSVEDVDLLTIRSRGTYARLLEPLPQRQQSLWEGLNYGLALIALVGIAGIWNLRRRSEEPMPLLDEADPAAPDNAEDLQAGGSDE